MRGRDNRKELLQFAVRGIGTYSSTKFLTIRDRPAHRSPRPLARLPGQWDESLTIIHYAGQALLLRTLKTGLPDKGLKETFLSPKLKPGMKFAGEFFIIHLAQFGDGSDGLTYRTSLLQGLQQKVLREG